MQNPMKGNLPPLVDVQLQDYFAVGAECPTLTQIFSERGLIPNPPEGNKLEWMLENFVTDADIDSCLHDPSNSTSYLDNNGIWVNANDKLEYKIRLEEAAR
ncbi:Threonine--tRNA ligase [Orchesella cincta]|uniref:Threonine--tRNA ligase n=1 Tax=Orchesella cincta TaxID=48709 RepID=A0A1D2MP21_ORCCI|nr:Threonine--tRNA ligase [Orchesella cincta]